MNKKNYLLLTFVACTFLSCKFLMDVDGSVFKNVMGNVVIQLSSINKEVI